MVLEKFVAGITKASTPLVLIATINSPMPLKSSSPAWTSSPFGVTPPVITMLGRTSFLALTEYSAGVMAAPALGITMVACEFEPDHAHVFVSNCKNHAVTAMAQRLKGACSRRIRLEFWERVKDKLWGDSFWSDGYFYRSICSTTNDAVQYYIEYSQKKHWMRHNYEEEQQRQEAERAPKQARLDEF